VEAWQQTPAAQPTLLHTPLWQSSAEPQARAVGQLAQGPPQSTSDSPPFFTLSVQLGAAQLPAAPHTPLWQSAPVLHAVPSTQPGQPAPQSIASPSALRTPSPQEVALHSELALGQ
jgi:hypothetical protein